MRARLIKWLKTVRLYKPACMALNFVPSCLSWTRRTLDWLLTELGFPLHAPGYRERLAFYSQFVHKGDLCFDIGANLGNRTEVFIALGASSVAVEPQDYCVRRLRKRFRKSQRVTVVPKAVGEQEGTREMLLSNLHLCSSLSSDWVDSNKVGHLSGYTWQKRITVPVTTVKTLMHEYGKPAFLKIDVEGFEPQVLSTLSEPIDIVSFEFSGFFIDAAVHCVNHLSAIGVGLFNYSVGESMSLALKEWVTDGEMCAILKSFPGNILQGDVYAMTEERFSRLAGRRSGSG